MAIELDIRILQLICSRLCHDFAGVIGAVNNGIELIEEMGGGADPEAMELVSKSAKDMARRLQFFRVAFGLAPGIAKTDADALEIARDYFSDGKIELEWVPGPDTPVAYNELEIKLFLNLLILAAGCLPRGGTLGVQLSQVSEKLQAAVLVRGEGARIGAEAEAALDTNLSVEDVTARTVQGYFTSRMAEFLGIKLSIQASTPDEIVILARP